MLTNDIYGHKYPQISCLSTLFIIINNNILVFKNRKWKKNCLFFKFLTQQPIHPIVTPFLIRKPRGLVNNSSIGDLPSNAGDNYYSLGTTLNDVRHYQLICNHKILITLKKCKSLVLPLQ